MARPFDLLDREEQNKVKKVVSFELDEINKHFEESIKSIEDTFEIYNNLENDEQKCDILRYQVMFLESAVDFYMHEIIKYGMKKMYIGEWNRSTRYKNFQIKMEDVHELFIPDDEDTFEKIVNDTYEHNTFMSPTEIKKCLNLLDINHINIANKVFFEKGSKENVSDKFKNFLEELYDRRNRIVHQSDRSHQDASKFEINLEYTKEKIDKVKSIIEAINHEIRTTKEHLE